MCYNVDNESGVKFMEKGFALKVTKALTDLEEFELFIEEIEKVCADFELVDFKPKLFHFLNEELKIRKETLKKL